MYRLQFHLLSTVSVQMTTGKKIKFYAQRRLTQELAPSLLRWLSGKEFSTASAGDSGYGCNPGLERSLGGGNGYPQQCPVQENSHGQWAQWTTVHRVKQSDTEHVCISLCPQPKNIIRCLVEHYIYNIMTVFMRQKVPWSHAPGQFLGHIIYNWIICGRTSQSFISAPVSSLLQRATQRC